MVAEIVRYLLCCVLSTSLLVGATATVGLLVMMAGKDVACTIMLLVWVAFVVWSLAGALYGAIFGGN